MPRKSKPLLNDLTMANRESPSTLSLEDQLEQWKLEKGRKKSMSFSLHSSLTVSRKPLHRVDNSRRSSILNLPKLGKTPSETRRSTFTPSPLSMESPTPQKPHRKEETNCKAPPSDIVKSSEKSSSSVIEEDLSLILDTENFFKDFNLETDFNNLEIDDHSPEVSRTRERKAPLVLPIPSLRDELTPSPRIEIDDSPDDKPSYRSRRDSKLILPIPSLRDELPRDPSPANAMHILPSVNEGNEQESMTESFTIELDDDDDDQLAGETTRRRESVYITAPFGQERDALPVSADTDTKEQAGSSEQSPLGKNINSTPLTTLPPPDRPLNQMELPRINGRTVLERLPEDEVNDTIEELRRQNHQLMLENQKQANQLFQFRKGYEERVTPFRTIHEELRNSKQTIIALGKEKTDVEQSVAVLNAQMTTLVQKAMQKNQQLQLELQEAKKRIAELEQQLE